MQIAPGLTKLFQKSLDTEELPEDWLNANISCVFKKGDKHAAENCRPVSLTSVPCKILEHIICKHQLNHLDHHNVLTSLNHGFRSGYSCETQLLVTMHDFMSSYDKGKQVDVAILDFSKAFDTVSHGKLLHKLNQYGVRGPIHSWLTSFLTKRVPQGTVLRPILFLCHINDLPDAVKSQVRLFADDCLLCRPINSQKEHDIVQQGLNNLETWADNWGIRFKAKKCYILSIKQKSSKLCSLNGHILEQIKNNPYLGLQISENMKWSTHINNTPKKKASSTLGFLRRNL